MITINFMFLFISDVELGYTSIPRDILSASNVPRPETEIEIQHSTSESADNSGKIVFE